MISGNQISLVANLTVVMLLYIRGFHFKYSSVHTYENDKFNIQCVILDMLKLLSLKYNEKVSFNGQKRLILFLW